jgi:hypothetical protein
MGMTRKPSIVASSGLDGAHRVDLGDDDVRAVALRAHREAPAAPAVARDDDLQAGEKNVRGADDPVDCALPRAVAVVEEVLRLGVVHRHDGVGEPLRCGDASNLLAFRPRGLERLLLLALLRQAAQANHAGRRLLSAALHLGQEVAALRVKHRDQVGAVVHRELGLRVERAREVLVVRVVVLALDGKRRDAVFLHERRGHVVLRRERIRGAERDLGPAVAEGEHQVRRLRGHMKACGDTQPLEGLFLCEALADFPHNGHVLPRPPDAVHALRGEGQILYVMG